MTKRQEKDLRAELRVMGFTQEEADHLIESQKLTGTIYTVMAILGLLFTFGMLAYIFYMLFFVG